MSSGKERKRERYLPLLFRPRSNSPLPPSRPSPRAQLSNPAPGSASETSSVNPQGAHLAPSSNAALPANLRQNRALSDAIKKHLANLSEAEKDAFLSSSRTLDERHILDRISTLDQSHHDASRFRKWAPKLENTLRVLHRFMDAISVAMQGFVEPSSIVIGAMRIVLNVATGFVEFFTKLAEMICRLGDFLGPLAEYAKAPSQLDTLQESLAAVYGDLLQFCRSANTVFTGSDGQRRTWASFRIFWRVNWVPFEVEFGSIESNFQHHSTVLLHSSLAVGLTSTLETRSQDEGISTSSF